MSSNTVACTGIAGARSPSERPSDRGFVGVVGLVFVGGAALTIRWCESMSAMGGMPMPGGWTMSMAWMRMPGQSWLGAAASFVGMWAVMMVAMMLPSLAPTLWRYRQEVAENANPRRSWPTALIALGYFSVWASSGTVVFALGVTLAQFEMRLPILARAVPLATGVVVLTAGAFQCSAWKAHHLGCCRDMQRLTHTGGAASAWRNGLQLGLHCSFGCAGMTAILLVIGVMDLRTMAAVTAAIAIERLAPDGERIARAIGAIIVAVGLCLIARAA